jgi:hypothetical protein
MCTHVAGLFCQLCPGSLGALSIARLSDILHLVCEVAPRSRRWQRLPVPVVQGNRFLHDLAQLVEHRLFIAAVATTVYQAGRASDVALIFVRPFDDLGVSRALFHDFDSSIARFTVRTW